MVCSKSFGAFEVVRQLDILAMSGNVSTPQQSYTSNEV
jgi:hypothetical protein